MDIVFGQSTNGGSFAAFLPLVLMFLIFYMIVIRPQSKQRKNHQVFLKDLKKGKKILTRGGIYGTIVNFQGKDNNIVVVDIGKENTVNIDRSYIINISDK